MLRTRLRTGASGFDPGSLFAGGGAGIWIDPSTLSTLYQDSAGSTPVTAAADPVGKANDRSGRANHLLQGTAAARPTYQNTSGLLRLVLDGTDDGMSTAVFAAGTLTAGMDMFIVLRRNAATQMVVASEAAADPTQFIGAMASGNATLINGAAGTAWTCFVDGVQVGGTNTTTREQLHTAVGNGSWKALEIRNLDLSAWAQFTIGAYASWMLNADVAGLILCPAQTDTKRSQIRRWLGNKVGLSL